MMPVEENVVDALQRIGPCCLEDVATYLPNFSWGEIFLAVDRMSRDGRVSLLQIDCSTYQISLRPQVAQLSRAMSGTGV